MIETIYSNPKAFKDTELMHYGRKGMKWGQHIYGDENYYAPNKTGVKVATALLGPKGNYPLAASAYRPSDKGVGATTKIKEAFTTESRKDKNKNSISVATDLGKSTKDAAQAGSNIADRVDRIQKRSGKDSYDYSQISQMSDAELRQRINRINMERQYAQLTQPQVQSGAERAKEVLDTVGDVATVVIAVGTAVTAIKKIKG